MAETELESVDITRRLDEPVICIPRRCEFTRIIVSLSRNQNLWLTSLGWRPEEKSVALKCDNTGDGLAIYLPKKFAREITPDDIIHISCLELGFKGHMPWGGAIPDALGVIQTSVKEAARKPEPVAPAFAQEIAQGANRSKVFLLGGISALVIASLVGFNLFAGDKAADVKTAQSNPIETVNAPEDSTEVAGVETTDTPSIEDRNAERRKAAEAVAAEIEAKKDEADQAAAKLIQDKIDAEAAAEKAKIDAANKVKAEKAAAVKRAADKKKKAKEAKEAEAKRELEVKAFEARKADEALKAAKALEAAKALDVKPAVKPAVKPISAPELTASQVTQLQNDLNVMGYFTGQVDGVLDDETISSATFFKSIFELPKDTLIDAAFLKDVRKERQTYEERAATAKALAVAEAEKRAAEEAKMRENKVASLPAVVSEPAAIVPYTPPSVDKKPTRKLLKRPALEYPNRPLERSTFTEVVSVVISYGIDASGDTVNVAVLSNSHKGMFVDDFNNAALKLAKRFKFEEAQSGQGTFDTGDFETTVVFRK